MMHGSGVSRLLRDVGYEVLPLKGTEDKVIASIPKTTRITVTASPTKALDGTLALAERLAAHGYPVAPHLSARMIHDKAELRHIVGRMGAAGITSVFVIAGDGDQCGRFPDAIGLLRALDEVGHGFTDVGVAGYPEGHPAISEQALWQALADKAPYATRVVTQICFNPRVTIRWVAEARRRGIELPVWIGVPGAVTRQKLVRISARIGLGASARFLAKQQALLWRAFLPRGYDPGRLVQGLGTILDSGLDSRAGSGPDSGPDSGETGIRGLHMFTFNQVEETQRWRERASRVGGR
jgi:methylenetetrahydrofolate reductase (NADPH)